MPVQPVFDRAVPAPDDQYFTNGERAITVASDIGAVPNGTYRLARFLNVRPGVYMLEAVIRPSGTLTINGVTLQVNGLIRTQIDVPQGNQRIDITLTKSGPGNCFAAFLLFQSDVVAYASSGDYWVWDTSAIATPSIPALPDARLSMPVFGVKPNWKDGITERLSYSTSILESETGVEQRRAIRQSPRRVFEVAYLRSEVLRSRLENLLAGVGVREVLLPLWHDQLVSRVSVAANSTSYTLPATQDDNPRLREFRDGDAVLLTNGDPLTQEVCIVGSVNMDTGLVQWAKGPTKNWPVGTLIVPLRKATITEKSSMTMHTDRVGSVTVRFALSDPMTTEADWGFCVPVWRFPVNRREALNIDFDRKIYDIDNGSGPVRFSNPGERLFSSTRVQTLTRGRVMLAELRQFIAASRGRAVGFYAPSGSQAIIPVGSTISGTFIEAEHSGFLEAMPNQQEPRKHIAIVFRDDSPTIYRKLIAVTEGVGLGGKPVERYAFSEEIPEIRVSNINRIEWVVPSRFDQDTFELKHLVDQSGVVQSSFVFRSVDGSAMVDISCDVTSLMYPLELLERLDVGMTPVSGVLVPMPKPLEEMDVGLQTVGGQLFTPLVTYPGYTRASTATYIDGGVLKYAAVDEPRYQDGVLLVEGEATNLLRHSQDFGNGFWSGCNRTLSSSTFAGIYFWNIAKTSSTGSEGLGQFIDQTSAGNVFTATIALQAGTSNRVQVGIFGGATHWGENADASAVIISGPGVVSNQFGAIFVIEGLSDLRPTLVSITRTFKVSEDVRFNIYPGTASSTQIGDSVLCTRAQLEPGPTSTSYIPTTTAPVTRAADLIKPMFEMVDVGMTPLVGQLFTPLTSTTAPAEGADVTMAPITGSLVKVLITYPNYQPEAVDSGFVPVSGTLETALYTWDELNMTWDSASTIAWDSTKGE